MSRLVQAQSMNRATAWRATALVGTGERLAVVRRAPFPGRGITFGAGAGHCRIGPRSLVRAWLGRRGVTSRDSNSFTLAVPPGAQSPLADRKSSWGGARAGCSLRLARMEVLTSPEYWTFGHRSSILLECTTGPGNNRLLRLRSVRRAATGLEFPTHSWKEPLRESLC